jgi:mono/diheme cytochrome c family protein
VLHGFRGPIERQGVAYNNAMASWKSLSDQEIADVLTYVRSSALGNSGAAVTADEVKAVREATASRAVPYTEAELLQ